LKHGGRLSMPALKRLKPLAAHQARRGHKAKWGRRELQGIPVPLGLKDRKDRKAFKALRVWMVKQVRQAQLDHLGHKERIALYRGRKAT
jgi:hypothetical protein